MIRLTNNQYLEALKRMRRRIAFGEPLACEDSEDVGNKYTVCTWGLCTDDVSFWEENERLGEMFHTFRYGKPTLAVSSKYLNSGQRCPMDTVGNSTSHHGCFYRCRVFQGEDRRRPSRKVALRLYDEKITEWTR